MDLPNIFTEEVSENVISRLSRLSPETKPNWGKMNGGQMLAHCCVSYEMVYGNKHPKPNAIMKFFLKSFIKNSVTSDKPYPHNGPTAPSFIIKGDRDFDKERARLIGYIRTTQSLGEKNFDGKESHSFGVLNINEWNNMFYKHLDHHLTQFGV